MNMSDAENLVRVRGEYRQDEPMARHVSWRAGGRARSAYVPADLDDLARMLASLPPEEPVVFVGLGSNLLVRDGGFEGTVVFTHRVLGTLELDATGLIRAEAGVASPKVARFAAMHDRVGAEFLAGVPGTVGGALAMNAGCYGGETWRIVERVRTIGRDGRIRERTPRDYHIGYRHVALKDAGAEPDASDAGRPVPLPRPAQEFFVTAWFRLAGGDGAVSRATMKDLLARRIASQPLERPNAGSVFRNPPGDHAARLIEACGLKGRREGGAEISAKHANFIVNSADASAADIERLIEITRSAVLDRFGIALEPEVRIIGVPVS